MKRFAQIFLLLFGALLGGCQAESHSATAASSPTPTPHTIQLQMRPWSAAQLKEAPTLELTLHFVDQKTKQPVAADLFLYIEHLDTELTVVEMFPFIPCEAVHVCILQLPPNDPQRGYRLQVRAVGYADTFYHTAFRGNRDAFQRAVIELSSDR